MKLGFIKKLKSRSPREIFIEFFLFLLIFFFTLSLVREKSFFPFVKFKMFDQVVKDPVTTVFYVNAIDVNNSEFIIKKKLMLPMSLREVAALLNSPNQATRKVVSQILMNNARAEFKEIKKFRLYEYKCNCYDYYEQIHSDSLLSFISKTCAKKLLLEKNYE